MIRKFIKYILILGILMSFNSTTYATDKKEVALTLSVEERVDEILESVLWQYEKESIEEQIQESKSGKVHNYQFSYSEYVSRVDALVSIMRLTGMTDDITYYYWSSIHDDSHTASDNSSQYKGNYLKIACRMSEDFKNIAEYDENLRFYPLEYCTIGQALEFVSRCIYKVNNDYAVIAERHNLCSTDMISRPNDFITVGELREILINMYNVSGEVVFMPVFEYGKWRDYDLRHTETYYDRYKKSSTYSLGSIYLNGYEIRYAQNGWGTALLSFADIMRKNDIDIQWNNGRMTLTKSTGKEYTICLDDFAPNLRFYCDKGMYEEHIVYDSLGYIIPYGDSFSTLGQYEIIDGTLYIYPLTYQFLLSSLSLSHDIVYFDRSSSAIFPEYLR